jgi:hypothetical protein
LVRLVSVRTILLGWYSGLALALLLATLPDDDEEEGAEEEDEGAERFLGGDASNSV